MYAAHRSFPPNATAPASSPRGGAAELGQWRCAMEVLRELEYQFARARKRGNRELMLRLRGEVEAATLRSDLLLADAVAAAREFSPGPKAARACAGRS
jgi:hypothetical protein